MHRLTRAEYQGLPCSIKFESTANQQPQPAQIAQEPQTMLMCLNLSDVMWSVAPWAGMLYNLTADVKHREGFPNRFYFLENGTSNTTTGKVFARPNHVSCVTHTAYMRVSTPVPGLGGELVCLLSRCRVSPVHKSAGRKIGYTKFWVGARPI